MDENRLICGDNLMALRSMPDGRFDAIVTDPPAGVAVMPNAEWDDFRRARNPADAGRPNVFGRTSRTAPQAGRSRDAFIAMLEPRAREMLRVLRPDGVALVWTLPRTSYWTAWAFDQAGWELIDVISHLFAQGMRKHRELLAPAREDWLVVRPRGGRGRLQTEGCRIEPTGESRSRDGEASADRRYAADGSSNFAARPGARGGDPAGRHPKNVILSHAETCDEELGCAIGCPVDAIAQQAPNRPSGRLDFGTPRGALGYRGSRSDLVATRAIASSTGTAARFFFQSKPSRAERSDTSHATVKSIALCRYLVRLACPPGGRLLDAFGGSGTIGIAAAQEGMAFTLIEQNFRYCREARERLVRHAGLKIEIEDAGALDAA